jgi:GntR family transcriptional regulator/MocR family aminotransferase
MPEASRVPSFGGTSYWVRGPAALDGEALGIAAAQRRILIEPGRITFGAARAPRNYFRLAFSSIDENRIEAGIRLLSEVVATL